MSKYNYLNGLRGICCLIVLFDHSVNILKPDLRYTDMTGFAGIVRKLISLSPINIIYSGIGSVCIFFILSGFVLSLKPLETNNRDYILSSILKRYPRLVLPIIASMIFMMIVYFAANLFFNAHEDLNLKQALIESIYIAPLTHSAVTNYPLWTISFELLGSFLLLSVISIFLNLKKRVILFFIVFSYLFFTSPFYSLFLAGVILCELKDKKITHGKKMGRLLTFIFGIVLITTPYMRDRVELYSGFYQYLAIFKNINYEYLYQMLLSVGSIFIFYSIINSKLAIKILNFKTIDFIGKISFPLYLTHASILYILSKFVIYYSLTVTLSWYILLLAIFLPISIIVAYFFEKYIDVPSIKLSSYLSKLVIKRNIS